MPIHNILGRHVIWYDKERVDKYWPILSNFITGRYKTINNKNNEQIKEIFKDSFNFLCDQFLNEVKSQIDVSFYVYVHALHETSIEIWYEQLNGRSIAPFDENDFSLYRRVLKIILEQSCDYELIVGDNIPTDIIENNSAFQDVTENLLYLGTWIWGFASFVASIDMMGPIHGIEVDEKGIVSIITNPPYNVLIREMKKDYESHTNCVTIDNDGISNFKQAIIDLFNVDYDHAFGFLNEQLIDPKTTYGLLKIEDLKSNISDTFCYNKADVDRLFDGLTLTRGNKLSIQESVLQSQDINRYLYRPFLKVSTQLGQFVIAGRNKFLESISQLTTNAIPWNYAPVEWMSNSSFEKYVTHRQNMHDSILEDEVEQIFSSRKIPYERNIRSFVTNTGNNIRCDIKNVGEIDFIFINTNKKIIFVADCKYHRSRYDNITWKKEFSNFIESYETKLMNKRRWIENNIKVILFHFRTKHGLKFEDWMKYSVQELFIINAPNFYYYNGNLPCHTLYSLNQLLDDKHQEVIHEITFEKNGKEVVAIIERPYFQNAANILARR